MPFCASIAESICLRSAPGENARSSGGEHADATAFVGPSFREPVACADRQRRQLAGPPGDLLARREQRIIDAVIRPPLLSPDGPQRLHDFWRKGVRFRVGHTKEELSARVAEKMRARSRPEEGESPARRASRRPCTCGRRSGTLRGRFRCPPAHAPHRAGVSRASVISGAIRSRRSAASCKTLTRSRPITSAETPM